METKFGNAQVESGGVKTIGADEIVIERDVSKNRAVNSPKHAVKNGQNQQNYQNN